MRVCKVNVYDRPLAGDLTKLYDRVQRTCHPAFHSGAVDNPLRDKAPPDVPDFDRIATVVWCD